MPQAGMVLLKPGWEKKVQTTNKGGRLIGTRGYTKAPYREYVWCENGAVALTPSKTVSSTDGIDLHDGDLVTAVTPAKSTTVQVTLGATAATLNQYEGGFLFLNDAPASSEEEGISYLIKSHPAADASATLLVTLDEEDGIITALTADQQSGLHASPYKSVIVASNTIVSPVVAVPNIDVPASQFFWGQVYGPGIALIDGSLVLAGLPIARSNTTPGAVEVDLEDGTVELQHLGSSGGIVGVTTEYQPVLWNIL